jgi:hypothetical protein
VGTTEQSWLETALAACFFRRRRLWGIHAYTEVRVRVRERRFLIPDLCVVLGELPDVF